MVEYFMKTANPPADQGQLYDWMEVRADTIKTRSLTLVPESDDASTLVGFPSARTLIVRHRSNVAFPNNMFPCTLPNGEAGIYHGIIDEGNINLGQIDTTNLVSNGTRLGWTSGDQQYLQFEFHQPAKTVGGMMFITLDFLIFGLQQQSNSLPAGTTLRFTVQMFQATNSDFSNEIPVPGDFGNDHMLVQVSGSVETATNKQSLHFVIGTPPNTSSSQLDYYMRFKIARNVSTTDVSTLWIDQITLNANSFDYVA